MLHSYQCNELVSSNFSYSLLFMNHQGGKQNKDLIKTEYHRFPENTFCSGAAFLPKQGGHVEDDGWIITYTHNEDSNTSQVSSFRAN